MEQVIKSIFQTSEKSKMDKTSFTGIFTIIGSILTLVLNIVSKLF